MSHDSLARGAQFSRSCSSNLPICRVLMPQTLLRLYVARRPPRLRRSSTGGASFQFCQVPSTFSRSPPGGGRCVAFRDASPRRCASCASCLSVPYT